MGQKDEILWPAWRIQLGHIPKRVCSTQWHDCEVWSRSQADCENQPRKITGNRCETKENLINVNRRPGSLTLECFNFPLNEECFANWAVQAWRGSCQASGVFICVPSKSQPGAVTFGEGDAPMRPFTAQLADESLQKPPCSKKVPGSEVIG